MITTKTCSTCEHFPNDHYCVGCLWDENKGENTNPIVIERAVLDKIRAEIEEQIVPRSVYTDKQKKQILAIIDKYRNEVSHEQNKGLL